MIKKANKNMAKTSLKNYVVIYRSQEHNEVLGYVKGSDMEEAKTRAQRELKEEAKFYNVGEATIGELKDEREIIFDIEQ